MKKNAIAALLMLTLGLHAQEKESKASVEKSVFSLETGLVGLWANNEFKLGNQFALRTEIGAELFTVNYDTYYGNGNVKTTTKGFLVPTISVEPKWYYNLEKRIHKEKNIAKNSGNAFSIKLNYMPSSIIAGSDDIAKPNHIAILPKWGIRRVYGKHFTFETGFGIGPQFYLGDDNYYKKSEVFVDVVVRIGYTF